MAEAPLSPLVIAVAQPACTPHDVAANAAAHAAAVRSAGARVVVFPEMSLTGYELDAPAITADDHGLASIVAACAETGSVALAGAPVQGDPGRSYIGMIAVDGEGATVVYRKMFVGGDEPERFTAGEEPAVIEVDRWRLGLGICKDTGVPEQSARTAALGIDAYVAGVLEVVERGVVVDERARRIASDHHVWVAIASFAGSTGGGYDHAAGRSAIWKPGGDLHAQAGPEVGAILRATLDPRQASI